jgi:hypothetical protein
MSARAIGVAAGPRTHAVALGAAQPPLYMLMTGRKWKARLALLTAGADPPLAMMHAGAPLADRATLRAPQPLCAMPRLGGQGQQAAAQPAVRSRGFLATCSLCQPPPVATHLPTGRPSCPARRRGGVAGAAVPGVWAGQ